MENPIDVCRSLDNFLFLAKEYNSSFDSYEKSDREPRNICTENNYGPSFLVDLILRSGFYFRMHSFERFP